jgi:hypothetical protein
MMGCANRPPGATNHMTNAASAAASHRFPVTRSVFRFIFFPSPRSHSERLPAWTICLARLPDPRSSVSNHWHQRSEVETFGFRSVIEPSLGVTLQMNDRKPGGSGRLSSIVKKAHFSSELLNRGQPVPFELYTMPPNKRLESPVTARWRVAHRVRWRPGTSFCWTDESTSRMMSAHT